MGTSGTESLQWDLSICGFWCPLWVPETISQDTKGLHTVYIVSISHRPFYNPLFLSHLCESFYFMCISYILILYFISNNCSILNICRTQSEVLKWLFHSGLFWLLLLLTALVFLLIFGCPACHSFIIYLFIFIFIEV